LGVLVVVNPDPDPAAGNPFAYVGDDPLDVTDPTGHCGWTSPLSCVTAVVSKAKTVAKAVVKKVALGARWYDPAAGDFTSADTVQVSPEPDPAAGNPFAYAADDPLDLADPSGHKPVVPYGDPNYQSAEKALLTQYAAQQSRGRRQGPGQAGPGCAPAAPGPLGPHRARRRRC
jgi:RHS repeat-associated protein